MISFMSSSIDNHHAIPRVAILSHLEQDIQSKHVHVGCIEMKGHKHQLGT